MSGLFGEAAGLRLFGAKIVGERHGDGVIVYAGVEVDGGLLSQGFVYEGGEIKKRSEWGNGSDFNSNCLFDFFR